jgi:ATP-dependent Clp protease ATP-binding subunit ClpB
MPMNLEKFTERSRGFLQAAQTIAMRESHQRVLPDHLLKALMDDDQGLAANLIRKAGGRPEQVNAAINAAIAKLPKVSGGDGQTYVDPRWCGCWTRRRPWRRRPGTALFRWNAC